MPVQSQSDFRPLTEASAKLPGALSALHAGAEVAISAKSLSKQVLIIRLSHPLAPQQPSFQVHWVFEVANRRFALIEENSIIEPDDRSGPQIQSLVEVRDCNTIAGIEESEFESLIPTLKDGIIGRRSLPGDQWNQARIEDLRNAFALS